MLQCLIWSEQRWLLSGLSLTLWETVKGGDEELLSAPPLKELQNCSIWVRGAWAWLPPSCPHTDVTRRKPCSKVFRTPPILPGLREVTQLGRGLDQTWQQAADNIVVSLLPWVIWEIWYLVRVYTVLYNHEQGLLPDSLPRTKAGRLQSFPIGHGSQRLLGQGSSGQGKKAGAP